jgi:hypothetical protein
MSGTMKHSRNDINGERCCGAGVAPVALENEALICIYFGELSDHDALAFTMLRFDCLRNNKCHFKEMDSPRSYKSYCMRVLGT